MTQAAWLLLALAFPAAFLRAADAPQAPPTQMLIP